MLNHFVEQLESIISLIYSDLMILFFQKITDINCLSSNFVVCLMFSLYSFVWSIVGNNYSKVDQIWSITPVIYSWHYISHFKDNHRLLLVCALITLWGIRLTYNFWRRGE